MDKDGEYRREADEAYRMAESARSPKDKAACLKIAESRLELIHKRARWHGRMNTSKGNDHASP